MTARRELSVAVAGCLLGAALVLLAAGRPWAHVAVSQPGLPGVRTSLDGRDVAGVAAALGLVGLAGVVALAATRRRGRLLVGAIVLLAGIGVLLGSLVSADRVRHSRALTDKAPAAALRDTTVTVDLTAWRHVSAAGGVVLAGIGMLTLLRGSRWAALSGRYDAPGGPPAATAPGTGRPADPDAELWAALDRGDDPTEDGRDDPAP